MRHFSKISYCICGLILLGSSLFALSLPSVEGQESAPLTKTAEVTSKSDTAKVAPTPTITPVYSEEEKRAGLWRDGKAVFSDINLLDFLMQLRAPHYVRGYKPTQPIKFNHVLHVEKNKMECQYCHTGVAKSSYANIPSVDLCMGCHKNVLTDRPEIQKLTKYFEENKPIEWVPVNNLPEHAHFNHERHIKAGVGCQNCHGQVQKMDEVERVSSLKMGWCVSCHREKGATIDCAACHY